MKRYLHLFPLMAITAVAFTLAACDDKKEQDQTAMEQTAPTDQTTPPAATENVPPAPSVAPVVHVEGTTAYATAEGATTGVVFMNLINQQTTPDKLIGASTDIAGSVEIHESTMSPEGVMQMRKVDAIEIQPNQQITLKPDGYHLMLMNLKEPLTVGKDLKITLDFEKAPDVTVPVWITSPTDTGMPSMNGAAAPVPSETAPAPTTSAPDEPMPMEGTMDGMHHDSAPETPAAPTPAPSTDAPAADEQPAQ